MPSGKAIRCILCFIFFFRLSSHGICQVAFVAVKNPQCNFQLYIDSIGFTDTTTVFYFFHNNTINDTTFFDLVSMDSNAIIRQSNKNYRLLNTTGLNVSTPVIHKGFKPDSLLFSLIFPKINFPVSSLEFQENDTSAWHFKIVFLDTIKKPTTAIGVSINNVSSYCYKQLGHGAIDDVFQINNNIYNTLKFSKFVNTSEYVTSAYYLSSCSLKKGNYENAIHLGKEVLSLYEYNADWSKDNITIAWTMGVISDAYAKISNNDSADLYALKSIANKRNYYKKETLDEAMSWGKLAERNFKSYDYLGAITFGERNYNIKNNILGKHHSESIHAASRLCLYYMTYGWYSEAVNLAKQHINDTIKENDIDSYLDFCTILSAGYSSLGNEKMCLLYSQMGYDVLMRNDTLLESNLSNLVNLMHHLSPQKRIKTINKILKNYQPGETYYQILQELAGEYSNLKEYKKAISILNQCIEWREGINSTNTEKYSGALINLAILYYRVGDSNLAVNTLYKALPVTEKFYGRRSYEYARILEIAYLIQSEWGISLPLEIDVIEELMFSLKYLVLNEMPFLTYEESLSLWNSINFWFYDIYLTHFTNRMFDAYNKEDYSVLLVELPLMLYNHMLFIKGLMLNYQIIQNNNTQSSNSSFSEKKKTKNQQIRDFYKLSLTSPANVYDALDSNSMAIEFVQIPSNEVVALILSHKLELPPRMIPICSMDDLTKYSKNYNTVEFFEKFWGNLVEYMDGISDVYFSLDGILNTIAVENMQSLSSLPIKNVRLHRVSSTKNIVTQNQKGSSISDIALFGGLTYNNCSTLDPALDSILSRGNNFVYLPASYSEITDIDSIMKRTDVSSQKFIGENGSKKDFLSLSGTSADVIHVATHSFYWKSKVTTDHNVKRVLSKIDNTGVLHSDSALVKSGILLSASVDDINDESPNCILTSYEISSMDLSRVDLVVLSSCQSGLGDVSPEGIIGLQRAFKVAGANTLLLSLWSVDDNATQLMMNEFYSNLISGKTKLESLKKAQKYVREYTDENGVRVYENPIYWAAFVLLDAME